LDHITEHSPAPLPGRNSEPADSGGSRHRLMCGMHPLLSKTGFKKEVKNPG